MYRALAVLPVWIFVAACVAADGVLEWPQFRGPNGSGAAATANPPVATGTYYASPVAAGGYIYFTALNDGAITVLKAGAPEATVIAHNASLGERIAATPAIADRTLVIRSANHLSAFSSNK